MKSGNVFSRLGRYVLAAMVSAIVCVSSYAQGITLNLKKVSVREAIAQLHREGGYSIVVNAGEVDMDRVISVNVTRGTINDVLNQIFAGDKVKYIIKDNHVSVLKDDKKAVPGGDKSQSARNARLEGRVLDSAGEPLIGASVRISGTTNVSIADVNGAYVITGFSWPADVEVNYLGYEPRTIHFTGNEKMPYDIVLKESDNVLSDAVVVGYGVQKKENLTGAVAAVSAEDMKDRPVASVGQALQGMVPNLNITQSSGQPGAGSSFNIRGNTSPNGGSPLILVDGMETYLDRINSNDIETISVLKDASSAAIYGARAAFGVILVTTKSGKKEQRPTVTFDGRFSFSANTVSTDFETRGYYSAYIADTFMKTKGGVPYTSYTEYDYQRLWDRRNDKTENPERPWVLTEMRNGRLSYVYLGNFDWYHYVYDESRPTQDYNVTVRGGSKTVTYMVSGRFYRQNGVWRQCPDDYTSFNTRAKVDVQITPWLKLSNNTKIFNGTYSYGANNFRKPILHALASFVPENPDGTAVSHTVLTNSSSHYIMDGYSAMMHKGKNWGRKRTFELTTSWALTADITKRLKFNADFSYKFGYLRNEFRDCSVEYSEYPGEILQKSTSAFKNQLSDIVYEQNNYVTNAYLSYDNTWSSKHHFSAVAGFNYETRHYKDLNVVRQDLLSEDLSDFNLATGEVSKLTGGISEYSLAGFFFRAAYDFKGKYLAEIDGRYDGSSRFVGNNVWGFFPSASAAWRISEEGFWDRIRPVVNNVKFRVSYGSLGNQNIGYYDYYQNINTKGTMSYTFDGSTLGGHATVDDPVSSGTWETVVSKNVGLDLGLLKDRLTFTGDMYVRDTKGILTKGKKLPSIYGATEPKVNANDIRTKGWELQIEWKDSFMLAKRRFGYYIGGNIADYTAKYTRTDNPSGLISEPYKGKHLGEIWGFRVGGLFGSDEEAAEYASRVDMSKVCKDYYGSVGITGVRGGDMKYLDLNEDGELSFGQGTLEDHGDRVVIGNSQPRFLYGFHGGFDYRGIDFSVFFQGIGHQDWYPGSDNMHFWGPYSRPYVSFVGKDFMSNVWSEDNKDAYFPRPRGYSALNPGALYYTNDRYLQNLAYLRLKNLTLGYTLPEKLTMKAKISKLRVYFSGENLWYTSPVKKHNKYVDPELLAIASNKNGDTYSFYKTFSFGVTVTF